MKKSNKYAQHPDPNNASALELLEDLKIRSLYYSKSAKHLSKFIVTIEKRITIIGFFISGLITIALSLYKAGLITSDLVIWFSIVAGAIVTFLFLFNRIHYNLAHSVHLLYYAQQFYKLHSEIKSVMACSKVGGISEQELMIKYSKFNKKYTKRRTTLLEYSDKFIGVGVYKDNAFK